MTSLFKCTLEQDDLEEEYMGLYTNGEMIMNPIYGQICNNCCLSKGFKSKLGHNPKIFLLEIQRGTEKEFGEHIIRLTKVIPAGRVKARCAQLLIIKQRLWKVPKRVEERRERMMVGQRMILVLMKVWIERIELIVLHPYIFVPMVSCLSNT